MGPLNSNGGDIFNFTGQYVNGLKSAEWNFSAQYRIPTTLVPVCQL